MITGEISLPASCCTGSRESRMRPSFLLMSVRRRRGTSTTTLQVPRTHRSRSSESRDVSAHQELRAGGGEGEAVRREEEGTGPHGKQTSCRGGDVCHGGRRPTGEPAADTGGEGDE